MIVITFDGSQTVIGPFSEIGLAQYYLTEQGYERISDIFWKGTHPYHKIRAHIVKAQAPLTNIERKSGARAN